MKTVKRLLSIAVAFVMVFSMCATLSAHAAPMLMDIKIVSQPDKLKFYKGTDWDYGEWEQPGEGEWVWVQSDRISFLRNGGCGSFPDVGMIDATGLVLELSYSDKTTKTVTYTETATSWGVAQNINLAPEKGFYETGKVTVEVWLDGYGWAYDTYEIEIVDGPKPAERQKGDINNDTKVNSSDALLVLQYSVGLQTFDDVQKFYADMNNDTLYNSSDALVILQKSVGL